MIKQALTINPLNQASKDWPGLVDCFDGAGSTYRAANNSHTFNTLLLLLGWHQATTIRTCGVPTLMLFAIHCAPLIHQVFIHEWLTTVGAAGCYPLTKAFRVIGHPLVHLKTCIAYGSMAGSAKEVLWVPVGSKGIDVVSPDGLFALLTNWI